MWAKDDPWVMAKLPGLVAREEQQAKAAKARQQKSAADYSALKLKGMHPDRFAVLKQSIDGSCRQWGIQRHKTAAECRDTTKYPLGVHSDWNGDYVWVSVLTECLR